MNRVLRSLEISDESVTISVQRIDEDALTAPEAEPSEEDEEKPALVPEEDEDGEAVSADTASKDALPDGEEADGSEPEADATADADDKPLIGAEVAELQRQQAEQQDEAPGADEAATRPSALDIEKKVEARLTEFEARFQQEKEDAYHTGFEDGTNEGTKQGIAQSAEEIERFQALVETLPAQWKDAVKSYDIAVADLALRIAQKIVSAAADVDEQVILEAVRECLGYVEDRTKIIIRVNPDDLEAVRRHRDDWLGSLESIGTLLIEPEPTVSKGGCIVETPIGDVDAQVEERLKRIRLELVEAIRKDDGEDA